MDTGKLMTRIIWGETGDWVDPAYKSRKKSQDFPVVEMPEKHE